MNRPDDDTNIEREVPMSSYDCSANPCENCPFLNGTEANDEIDAAMAGFSRDNLPVIYISGPMSGYPDYNFPMFREIAKLLRFLGFPVIDPSDYGADPEKTWNDAINRDLVVLGSANAVLQLNGWRESKGARIENEVALAYGIPRLEQSCFDRFIIRRFFNLDELNAIAKLFQARENLRVIYDAEGRSIVGDLKQIFALLVLDDVLRDAPDAA